MKIDVNKVNTQTLTIGADVDSISLVVGTSVVIPIYVSIGDIRIEFS
jgi:hypothetical protein